MSSEDQTRRPRPIPVALRKEKEGEERRNIEDEHGLGGPVGDSVKGKKKLFLESE